MFALPPFKLQSSFPTFYPPLSPIHFIEYVLNNNNKMVQGSIIIQFVYYIYNCNIICLYPLLKCIPPLPPNPVHTAKCNAEHYKVYDRYWYSSFVKLFLDRDIF